MAVRVRALSEAETKELERRAHARTEPARVVERARLLLGVAAGESVPAVARRLGIGADVLRLWIKRFNADGLAGLTDRRRSGRPATYTAAQLGAVIATSLTPPEKLGQPFACWTLDRLTTYRHERPAAAGGPLPISRSQLDRVLTGEGLRWRQQETWFGERVDPHFAEKRGRSSASAPARPPGASSWTLTKWGRKAPRAIPA
ncbi:MAG: helix-turn-helix domain containing protein [Chloroflexi bacterium]|nr:helix-turn-helix domain containing protein [Chloroflexota bacterium]